MWHNYHILQTSHICHYGDDNDYYMLPVPCTNIKNVIICRNYVILSKGDYSLSNLTHTHRLSLFFEVLHVDGQAQRNISCYNDISSQIHTARTWHCLITN